MAWPDLLGAYNPSTRRQAMAHVIVALGFASICWQPRAVSFVLARALGVMRLSSWSRFQDLLFNAFLFFFLLSAQILLPVAYLWIIRFRNLRAPAETSVLQADLHNVLQVVATLKQHSEARKTHGSNNSAPAASAASDTIQTSCNAYLSGTGSIASDQFDDTPMQLSTSPEGRITSSSSDNVNSAAGCGANQPNLMKHDQGAANIQTLTIANPQHSNQHGVQHVQVVHASLEVCQNPQTSPETCPEHASDEAIAADFEQQNPEAFQAGVTAALEASSKIIANLTARLEAVVHLRSGTQIQGHAECSAALAM